MFQRIGIWCLAASLVAAAGCSSGAEAQKDDSPQPAEETQPAAESAGSTEMPPGANAEPRERDLTEAQKLARQVMDAAGAEALDQVAEVNFTFVVYAGDKKVFQAQHRYDRRNNRDRITWVDPDSSLGNRFDILLDLDSRRVDGKIDGEPIETEEERREIAEVAYKRWVNDYYWYAMPLKLRDPGVNLEIVDPRTWRDQEYQVLKMTYEDVGLTPGDQYWLYIDPQTQRIDRWDMLLQGMEGDPLAVSRAEYRSVGPLTLSHTHNWLGADRTVAIENTSVSSEITKSDYHFDATDFVQDDFADYKAPSSKPNK